MLNLFVRGWQGAVTEEELKKRFQGFPGITSIEKVDLNKKGFAHVTLRLSENEDLVFEKLKDTYKKAKWKGGLLTFDKSRPNFMQRLEQEKEKNKKENNEVIIPVFNENETLRIKKCPGSYCLTKKARLIIYPDEVEVDNTNKKLPISQDPAYCCTKGDAGPQFERIIREEEEVEEENQPTPLSIFTTQFLNNITQQQMNQQKKKDSSHSILGIFKKYK